MAAPRGKRGEHAEDDEKVTPPLDAHRPEDADDSKGLGERKDDEDKTDAEKDLERQLDEEDRNLGEPKVHVPMEKLVASRAVVDTSGTAGPADHDIRVGSATWDQLTKDRAAAEGEDVPEHLEQYITGSEGIETLEDIHRPDPHAGVPEEDRKKDE